LLAWVVFGFLPSPARGQNFAGAVKFGVVEAFEITEASGLAASRQNPGVLWTHNDNNYIGTLFAISTNGALLGSYTVPFVFTGDFEDMAIGPGPRPEFQYLYFGDIGDNFVNRSYIRVFRIPEPAVYTNAAAAPWYRSTVGFDEILLRYPDGPFNAESLMIDPLTGDLFIATKMTNSARIYRASRAQLEGSIPGEPLTMSFLREISFFKVSGGDISFDGRLIALRRGGTAWVWNRSLTQTVGDALAAAGKSIPVAAEANGEAIAFHATGLGYFTLSEGYGQTNYYYRRTDSGVPRQPAVFIAPGATWRYDDTGTDLGTAWRNLNYNDSAWSEGPAQLGYGQGDEGTTISFGLDDFEKNPTTYFRRKFNLTAVTVTNVALRVCFNDGVAVYLNGSEVWRRNLSTNASYPDAALFNASDWQNIWHSVPVSPANLRVGTNVVAVEVHRYSEWGPDLSFDLQLLEGAVEPPVRFVEAPRLVSGHWQLKLSGPPGALGVVEGSTDMATWSSVGEVVLTSGQGTVTDPSSPPERARFYRVKR
jgi:hypothetical protein